MLAPEGSEELVGDELVKRVWTTLTVGDDLVVRLPEPATAGYAWEVADTGATLEPVDDPADEQVQSGGSVLVGGAPVRTFHFRPTAPGPGHLALVLRRPFEPDAAPVRRLDLALQVTGPTDQADRDDPPVDPR